MIQKPISQSMFVEGNRVMLTSVFFFYPSIHLYWVFGNSRVGYHSHLNRYIHWVTSLVIDLRSQNVISAVKNMSPNKSRSIFFKKISSNFIFTSSVCEENVHTVRCIPSRTPLGIYESIKSRSYPPVSISQHHNKLLVKAHSHSADIDFGLSNTVITAYYSHCDGLWGGRPVAANLSSCCRCQ